MTTTLWIVQSLLAVIFCAAGAMKLMTSKADLVAKGMEPLESLAESQIKLIGALELAGGLGVILPVALGIVPSLSSFAAIGLALIMLGAAMTHARRKELPQVGATLAIAGLAAFVAISHLG